MRYKFTSAVALGHNGLLRKIPGTRYWRVQEEFIWYIDYDQRRSKFIKYSSELTILNTVIVPKGLKTDFGSIPKPLWILFDKTKYISYILHDYLISKTNIDRFVCDRILIDAMKVEGAGSIERFFIYIGVRIGSKLGLGRKTIYK